MEKTVIKMNKTKSKERIQKVKKSKRTLRYMPHR